MDIIVKSVLDFIQSQEGSKNSIIAGGAVRDHIYKVEPKDYDVFVPIDMGKPLLLMREIDKEFGLKGSYTRKGKEYEQMTGDTSSVFSFNFEGKDFDVVFKAYNDDEEFADKVIEKFDFGVNMCYYNGLYVEDSNKHFKYDHDNYTMSLINIDRISNLPNAMKRYQSFCEKTKQFFTFRAPCLELVGGEKEVKKKFFAKTKFADPVPVHDEVMGVWDGGVREADNVLRQVRNMIERNDRPRAEPLRVVNPPPQIRDLLREDQIIEAGPIPVDPWDARNND